MYDQEVKEINIASNPMVSWLKKINYSKHFWQKKRKKKYNLQIEF